MERNQQIIIGGLLVAILILVGVTFFIGRTNPDDADFGSDTTSTSETRALPTYTPTPTGPIDQTIMVTFTGFIPESLTIKKGASVNFLNISGSTVVIESVDGNPALNLGEIASNEQALIRFDNVGTYNYRNSSKPEETGVIIVE